MALAVTQGATAPRKTAPRTTGCHTGAFLLESGSIPNYLSLRPRSPR
jgi:hypothetical protein